MTLTDARALIESSDLFDATWYSSNYADVALSGLAPAEHYLKIGAMLGRDPSRAFSTIAYLQAFPDVAEAAVNPLYHYLKSGRAEGRRLPQSMRHAAPATTAGQGDANGTALAAPDAATKLAATIADIEQLTAKLWGGYSQPALAALEAIKKNQKVASQDRAEVAFNLMQWYYVEGDFRRAHQNIELFNLLHAEPLSRRYVVACSLCLIKLGRFETAAALLRQALNREPNESNYHFLMAAVVRLTTETDADEAQLVWLAQAFEAMGLTPIEKKDKSLPLSFDNIIARPAPSKRKQDWKVSIIIPAYSAEATISYAVESLQLQTWRNIEIIVVDDCSPDATCDIIERMARDDSRIKLIRKTVNEGAYPARNTGLQHVTGDLIMIHDSDDWSHPEKIEIQIASLKKAKTAIGVMSAWIRVDDDFIPSVHSRPRNSLKSLSFPSLMFKREVIDQIGPWPSVRVSGDAEFKTRIERHYGTNAIARVGSKRALSISLSREDSLTQHSATHINSLHFGLRWHYRALYNFLHVHNSDTRYDSSDFVSGHNLVLGNRSKRNADTLALDCVYVSDFADESVFLNTIAAACEAGKKVAIFHWRAYGSDIGSPLSPDVYRLCVKHSIVILSPLDTVQTEQVVCLNVALLQELQDNFPNLRTQQVLVLVDRYCDEQDSAATLYDIGQVRANVMALFEQEPSWIPVSDHMARLMAADSRYPASAAAPLTPAIQAAVCLDCAESTMAA